MKNILYILSFIAVSYKATAQITYIPDQEFEQTLINLGIDSDGIINGQVLTSDVENVTELNCNALNWWFPWIYDLTGIQNFVSLEKLTINYTQITELDLSQNLQLKELDCGNNWLTSIDVSSNTLLEVLYIGNYGGDVGPFNEITEIDLSNNPLIHTFDALDLGIETINLKNGNNNSNITIKIGSEPWGWEEPGNPPYPNTCIIVDNATLANSSQYPYSEWTIYHPYWTYSYVDNIEECSLNTQSFAQSKIKIYPNPVSDMLYFEPDNSIIEKIVLFDLSGRKILEQNKVNNISVSHLQKGSYILKLYTDKGIQTEKIIVK